MTKELKNKNLGLCNLEIAQENLNNYLNNKTMENKKSNSQETVGALMTGAQKVSSMETENNAKLRNVSYDEVYRLFDNYGEWFGDDEDNRIDLGNGVCVQITDRGSIWDVGIETSDGNFRYTIDEFGDFLVSLLAGEEDYIDHLTHVLNEYIDRVNEENEDLLTEKYIESECDDICTVYDEITEED